MKSKMLATSMTMNASRKRPKPSAHAAPTLISTPMSVSVFGWMRSTTQRLMMPRSGRMHAAPMAPVKVSGLRGVCPVVVVRGTIMEGSGT